MQVVGRLRVLELEVLGLGFRPASYVEKKKKDDLGPSVQV